MWTVDASQHIHVEPSVREQEVLERATSVARLSADGRAVFVDLFALDQIPCGCGQPASWKTYQVILYAPEAEKASGSGSEYVG